MHSGRNPARRSPFWSQPLVEACIWCRRVRDADGNWGEPDASLFGVDVSHTICPDCVRERLPELADSDLAAPNAP
jgi:hypothetical protein